MLGWNDRKFAADRFGAKELASLTQRQPQIWPKTATSRVDPAEFRISSSL
jgi:hypothetical protein